MSPPADLRQVLDEQVVVLDGGLATELERAGHDLSGKLWSAVLLRDDPAAIRTAHRAYFDAGARVATTASYQASVQGFAAAGLDRDTAELLIRRSIELAVQARDDTGLAGQAWVAASVGPYGAVLAGGQEYTGDYPEPFDTVAGLRAFHRPRLELLAAAGADVLACETIPSLTEAEALLTELEALGMPAWLSLTTVTESGGTEPGGTEPGRNEPGERVLTRRGEDAAEAFVMAGEVDCMVAVGVNCTDPRGVSSAVRLASRHSGKPVVVYPNSGETWDGAARHWVGNPGLDALQVTDWVSDGARLVGGCCRIGPRDIAELAGVVRRSGDRTVGP